MSENQDNAEVFAKCRRGSDQATFGQECDSKQAIKLTRDMSNVVSFRCSKCSYTWSVPIGGSINL